MTHKCDCGQLMDRVEEATGYVCPVCGAFEPEGKCGASPCSAERIGKIILAMVPEGRVLSRLDKLAGESDGIVILRITTAHIPSPDPGRAMRDGLREILATGPHDGSQWQKVSDLVRAYDGAPPRMATEEMREAALAARGAKA